MIILTAEQAAKVRGISPTDPRAALSPQPLKDGMWMLPEGVLADPAHADVVPFLATLPTVKTIDPRLLYPEPHSVLTLTDQTDLAALQVKLAATADWRTVGVRKPIVV